MVNDVHITYSYESLLEGFRGTKGRLIGHLHFYIWSALPVYYISEAPLHCNSKFKLVGNIEKMNFHDLELSNSA